jgi:purine-binding chemotaxis protein CheW
MVQAISDSMQVVSFNIINSGKKEDYAVPIEQVREIRAVEKITKVPHSEPYVKGIMNLRGSIIPVIDVKEKLGLDSGANTNSSKQRILVAEVNNSLTGLLVDEVDQVMRIQTKDIESAPQGALESCNYVKGVAKINEKLVILLDVGLLLGTNKTENIQTTHKESKPEPQPTGDSGPKNESQSDIPPELTEVFNEDANGIPPTQIVR